MNKVATIRKTFERGEGILRLIPTFVPRRFAKPGFRLRLHPDDYYALGVARGAMKERWFSSINQAINGPDTPWDEGMSYVVTGDNPAEKFLFKEACDELKAELIGKNLLDQYGTWPMFAKFFDNETPLFHHMHLKEEDAQRVGRHGKPEAYYFPPQLNNHLGEFPVTYFGFDPSVSKEEVKQRLMDYEKKDTRITELSRAYRITLGTGWYTPAGVVHAPGSVLTYEPQWNSDVNAVFENIVSGEAYSRDFLVEHCPEDKKNDLDYVMSLMDWEENVNPQYKEKYFRPPLTCHSDERYLEKWVCYANPFVGAKELTVLPGQTVTVKDNAAYGCIIVQGHGKFGVYNDAEAAVMFRYGQMSGDEYFVSEVAAKKGVLITNNSQWEPLVILKHFGPNNSEMPQNVLKTPLD
jgi:hypothetical protein